MKKLLLGCIAVGAALIALSGCDQDKVVYNGASYLMFSDTLYTYAVQETNEIFNVPISATVAADHDRTFAVEVIDRESNARKVSIIKFCRIPLPLRQEKGVPI